MYSSSGLDNPVMQRSLLRTAFVRLVYHHKTMPLCMTLF